MIKVPILKINEFSFEKNDCEFYINNIVDHCTNFHNSIKLPHKHDFYLTILFTAGSGTHEIDFNSYEIKPGSIFLLNPGQTHNWKLSEDIFGYIFFHSESFYNLYFTDKKIYHFPFFYSRQNTPCINLPLNELQNFIDYFQKIDNEHNNNQLLNYHKIRNLIDLLYIDLTRIYNLKNKTIINKNHSYFTKLHQLEKLIEENYKIEKSPKEYAKHLNISTKHLNRIVQTLLNKTTQDLISERILLESKRMLISSKHSLSEIALELGYDDYSYFTRFFKKRIKQTPSEFLKKHQ